MMNRMIAFAAAGGLGMVLSLAGRPLAVASGNPGDGLTPEEQKAGWILLFDGKTLDGWKTSSGRPSKVPVEDGCHQSARLRRLHDDPREDLVRLRAVARLQDQQGVQQRGLHPDLPADAAPGQGRRLQRHRDRHRRHDDRRLPRHRRDLRPGQAVEERHEAGRRVEPHGRSPATDRDRASSSTARSSPGWTSTSGPTPNRRPDGSEHKFDVAYKDHPRSGLHRPAGPRRRPAGTRTSRSSR